MAAGRTLLDTGPLVALLSRSDAAHAACVAAFEGARGEFLSTEAVLTEAVYLLGGAPACLEFFIRGGAVLVPTNVLRLARCRALMADYADIRMDFADAGLVALADELGIGTVFTLDRRGFETYRWRRTRRFEILP